MSNLREALSAVVLMLAVAHPVCIIAQQTPPLPKASTPQDRAAVIEIAKKLQESPLDKELQERGRSLQEMLVHASDINATACDEEAPWGPWASSDYKYSIELMAIYTVSNAAFVISNAEKNDPKAAHMAGLEGAMNAYQVIVGHDPAARWKKMEQLISKRDKGDLQKESVNFCATPIPLKALAAVTSAALGSVPERFESGWLKGFTRSPTEHIINEADKPFTVRAVKGLVLDPSGAEMSDVIVEIQDANGRMRGTKTNSKGKFRFTGVPSGTYRFKVTRDGFQSVVGEIVVSKKANKADQVKVVMELGV